MVMGGSEKDDNHDDQVAKQEWMDVDSNGNTEEALRSGKEKERQGAVTGRDLEEAMAELSAKSEELRKLRDEMGDDRHKYSELKYQRQQLQIASKRLEGQLNYLDSNNRQLTRQVHNLQGKLDIVQAQYCQTHRLLSSKTSELQGLKDFLTTTDMYSDADIIAMIGRLNSEILQVSAFMADSFGSEYTKTRLNVGSEETASAQAWVITTLGEKMVHLLKSTEHGEDQTLIQTALQATMVSGSEVTVRSWPLEQLQTCHCLPAIFQRIRQTGKHPLVDCSPVYSPFVNAESPSVSGRWRALTRANMLEQRSDMVSHATQSLADAIAKVLVVAGWKEGLSQMNDKVMKKFGERLTTVASSAVSLNKVMGQDLTSAEFYPLMVRHGHPFVHDVMEDALGEPTMGAQSIIGRVLCTTDLGLLRQEKVSNGDVNTATLLKAKVALDSYFDDAERVVFDL